MALIPRLFGRASTAPVPAIIEPKRLIPEHDVKDLVVPEGKSSSVGLLPQGAYGMNYAFFSPDGGQTILDVSDGPTVIAFIAYWYIATRWRAQKIAEPPLMVVEEDQDSGDEQWLPDHELVPILEEPSPDYDMGELLESTSHYLDNTGYALWVLDKDRAGRIARITPFSRHEFEPVSDGTRLYASFQVRTSTGSQEFPAETCCFFRDAQSLIRWGKGKSRLDIAMSWLKLGAKAQATIFDLLSNSVWPSAVVMPDKDWDPDPKVFAEYKQDLEGYARQGRKGRPFVALGGGSFQALAANIKDLVPDEVLGRVESIVAAVSGVPAIVLQFQIGLENSPWSQMEEARKMAYDDCVQPAWKKIERVITRQMLRPVDEDPTHFVRFDATHVAALQVNRSEQANIAAIMGRAASVNERRAVMGLEPATPDQDPNQRADEIPELTAPSFLDIAKGLSGNNASGGGGNADGNSEDANANKDGVPQKDSANKAARQKLGRKFQAAVLRDAFISEAIPVWQVHALLQLKRDRDTIADIVRTVLVDASHKSIESKARGKDRVMSAVKRYLNEEGRATWTKTMQPLFTQGAQRSGAVAAADLNVNYGLLHPNLLKFAQKQTGSMITTVNKTTQSLISDIIQGGLDANKSTRDIAQLISDATGFDTDRALLIARTETTKVFNGGPEESLTALGEDTGQQFTKEWSGVLDDRERPEHVAMEGETVPVGEAFSNGLLYPSEPNCRCVLIFDEVSV
jgi:SPP1 gp7 family putative phage head morphogenesis protein